MKSNSQKQRCLALRCLEISKKHINVTGNATLLRNRLFSIVFETTMSLQ